MSTPIFVDIARALNSFGSSPSLFNPYTSRTDYDIDDAPAIRLANLRSYLTRKQIQPDTLILAEAPGPWGCRFTGIPITAEHELARPNFPVDAKICTVGPPRKEYSSGIFWRVLEPHSHRFVAWNAVPFHPFKNGAPDSIRTPTNAELQVCASITELVIDMFSPSRILALGRRPEKQLLFLGRNATYVRHPSQGGARAFEVGMEDAFGS